MTTNEIGAAAAAPQLRRVLRLRDLVLYGIVIVQPTAPMPIFGVVSQEARGHVVTAILIAMVAMLFTAISYGRMARAYPSAGSAYAYVGNAVHPSLGYLAGWSITMDYLLNPVISTIWCAKAAANFVPVIPYPVLSIGFALLFTGLNLRRVESSARTNQWLAYGLCGVVAVFFAFAIRYLMGQNLTASLLEQPFYDPKTFSQSALFTGTAISVLTYIGFDGVSTLSEEVENPKRNIMRATVLVCLITGALAALEVYLAQLIWPDFQKYPDVDTAFVHVAGRAGGPFLFALINLSLLIATIGSGSGSQLAAARLLFGMGRDNVIPKRFFGALTPAGNPRNGVLFSGALIIIVPLLLSYQLGVELLNFGAFIAFMGVNLAAVVEYCVKPKCWTWSAAVPPIVGFVVCFYIWTNLGFHAKVAGGVWLAAGLCYGAIRGTLNRPPTVVA